jgi:membrane-associated phospholipid phosphatase
LFIFLALLISGIITQILKHIIGRPRPKYADFENILNFDFFTLNSSFHSFPSGHTSTIFVIALCLSIIFPRIRYVLLFFASLVAFSRVVVGAHFLTDVIGGVIISVFALKLTIILFERFKIYKPLSVLNKINSDIVLLSIFIFIILVVFLAIGSDLDIYISSLFYLEEKRFFLQSYFKITIFFRKILLPFIVLYLTILPFFCIFLPIEKIYFGFKFKIKDALLVFFCFVFNLILITNLLLKDLWGRARPNEIIELGGIHNFSPWYMISDSCNKNCSFISGDAAVGFSIILLFMLTKNKLFFWCSVLFGSSIGFIRVLEGGHFLSDITMSGMIIFLLSYIQVCFYKKKYEKKIL